MSPARPALAGTLLLLASMLLAACGGSSLPTVPPVAPASPGGSSGPGSEPPDAVITAVGVQFDPTALTVPAGQPLTILFDNRDQGIPHDLVIRDAAGNQLVMTELITGPAQTQVTLGPLEPGAYPFVCTIHPNMVGQITAE